MRCHLEGLTPPLTGKLLPVTAERPATIKTTKGTDAVGVVTVSLVKGSIHLVNQSRIRCQVNGAEIATETELHDGDHLVIGKQGFRVAAQREQCSVCDASFDAVDQVKGWTDGDRRICARCIAKGVRPGNLASVEPIAPDADEVVDAAPGDDDTTEQVRPKRPATDSDRHRGQRRLSASRLAQVDVPVAKGGLLSKVGQVFSNREERKRLELLDQERRDMLEQAGRLAVSENNGFGIPDHLYNPLLKGVQVSLRLQDFSIPAIERWRTVRARLAVLDTEIAALRASLGLGPDQSLAPPPLPLAADQRARQDKAFDLMDAMATMELEGEDELDQEVGIPPPQPQEVRSSSQPQPAAKSVSGRRMQRRRR